MKFIFFILILFLIYGCNENTSEMDTVILPDDYAVSNSDSSIKFLNEAKFPRNTGTKEFSDMLLNFNVISAQMFLEHTGRAGDDIEELQDESVLILDYQLKNVSKDVLNYSSMSSDDLVQYFIGTIKNDISFKQSSETIFPSGVHYEGKVGSEHKVKVYFFVNGLDLDTPYEIIYNDKVFDKGQIKLAFNNPYILG